MSQGPCFCQLGVPGPEAASDCPTLGAQPGSEAAARLPLRFGKGSGSLQTLAPGFASCGVQFRAWLATFSGPGPRQSPSPSSEKVTLVYLLKVGVQSDSGVVTAPCHFPHLGLLVSASSAPGPHPERTSASAKKVVFADFEGVETRGKKA